MNLKKIVIGFLLFCSAMALFSQAQEFPKTMYVTATNGLRQRLTPSTTGKVVGTFLYCEPIQVREKSKNTVTIDGITDYWYKVYCDIYFEGKYVEYSYVFGGYVSDKLPADAPVTKFTGNWTDTSQVYVMEYVFSGNTFLLTYTGAGYRGKGIFSFTDNTITFRYLYEVLDSKSDKEGEWKNIDETETHKYSISNGVLKISRAPTSSSDYISTEVYTLNKISQNPTFPSNYTLAEGILYDYY
jgi:hypothetical protein